MIYRRFGCEFVFIRVTPTVKLFRFRSCVRCEAVCVREAMMLPSLGFANANSAPGRAGAGVPLAVGRVWKWASPWLCCCVVLQAFLKLNKL